MKELREKFKKEVDSIIMYICNANLQRGDRFSALNQAREEIMKAYDQNLPPTLTEEEIEGEIISEYNDWLSTTEEITVCFHKIAHALSGKVTTDTQKGNSICDTCVEICKATHPRKSCPMYKRKYYGKPLNQPEKKKIEELDYTWSLEFAKSTRVYAIIMENRKKLNEIIRKLNQE